MEKSGWIKLHRNIENNFLWLLEPFTKAQAWIDLILYANHKKNTMSVRGNIIELKRGQIGWSELRMARRWNWSKGKVRRFLKLLEMEQQIVQQKDRYITTIITILNYENYQSDTADSTAERQQKDSRQYINKNGKNGKNGKKEIILHSKSKTICKNDINFLISLFKNINPSYEAFYKNKTQRSALERMNQKFGRDKLAATIQALPGIISQKYAPRITTPLQLEAKLGELILFNRQNKANSIKKI